MRVTEKPFSARQSAAPPSDVSAPPKQFGHITRVIGPNGKRDIWLMPSDSKAVGRRGFVPSGTGFGVERYGWVTSATSTSWKTRMGSGGSGLAQSSWTSTRS